MSEAMRKSVNFWDRSAKRYEMQVKDDTATVILDTTYKYLHSSDRVLDFACATGMYALEIASQVKDVWAIDFSGEMIKLAERNAAKRGITNVNFMQPEITDQRLKDQAFNTIFAFNILHLVEDPLRTLSNIKDLLQPDGIFLSATPCLSKGGSLQELLIKCGSSMGIVPAVHPFKPKEVEALIYDAQFDLIESRIFTDQISTVFIASRKRL